MIQPSINLRRANREDIPSIAANNVAMARETEQKVLDPIRARNGVLQVLQDPVKGFYLVATTGDVLIGQCMVTFEWSDWRDGNFWWIQSVYVAIEYRKKGIFTLLYRELERMARREPQVVGLRLYVEQGNDSAVDIYTHLGMKETCYRILEIEFDKP